MSVKQTREEHLANVILGGMVLICGASFTVAMVAFAVKAVLFVFGTGCK